MKARTKRALQFACYAILCSLAFAGDDDDAPKPGMLAQTPALNAEQQRAVNLQVAHPVAATAPERTTALGVVLDATSLLSDESEQTVAEAQAAGGVGGGFSIAGSVQGGSRPLAQDARDGAGRGSQGARRGSARGACALRSTGGRWRRNRPRSGNSALDAVTSGRSLLVRADLPGQHIVGALPSRAVLDVDGIEVPGRVLGPLAQFSDSQSAGLLLADRSSAARPRRRGADTAMALRQRAHRNAAAARGDSLRRERRIRLQAIGRANGPRRRHAICP